MSKAMVTLDFEHAKFCRTVLLKGVGLNKMTLKKVSDCLCPYICCSAPITTGLATCIYFHVKCERTSKHDH